MRFFLATLALAAIASAQNSTSSAPSTTTAALSPQQTCLAKCSSTDICCQAACVNVPCPNEAQVNATTACAMKCVQGNGTEAETAAYAKCQQACISSNFLTTTGTGASATGTGASGSATFGASASSTGAGASGSASRSASGTAASATSKGSASETRSFIAGAGLFGLVIAGLAL